MAKHSARVPGGYDALVRELADGLEVWSDHAVERVEWRGGSVRVSGSRMLAAESFGPVQAAAAVLTLPLGVLAAPKGAPGQPELLPFPTAWTVPLRGLEMGGAVRLILVFDRPVADIVGDACPEAFDGFIHAPSSNPSAFWTLSPLSDRVLVAWAGGPRARSQPERQEERVQRTLEVLEREAGVSGEALRRSLLATFSHDWEKDPWARGAYAYPGVGGDSAAEALSAPVEGTLFLAGEAASEEMGTVEGALESGYRAAARVLDTLGRAGA
jgi:monoamine oxidase